MQTQKAQPTKGLPLASNLPQQQQGESTESHADNPPHSAASAGRDAASTTDHKSPTGRGAPAVTTPAARSAKRLSVRRKHLLDEISAAMKSAGVAADRRDVERALGRPYRPARVCSTFERRTRSHAAVILGLDRSLTRGDRLTVQVVLLWYLHLNGGLSANTVPDAAIERLRTVVDRVNSPPHDPRRAIREAAETHADLLNEPILPGFDAVIARLLLRFQLGRCGLNIPLPDAPADAGLLGDRRKLTADLEQQMFQQLPATSRRTRQRPMA